MTKPAKMKLGKPDEETKNLIEAARVAQRESGKKLTGDNIKDPATLSEIKSTAEELFSKYRTPKNISVECAEKLYKKFADMCRRRSQPSLSPQQRLQAMGILVNELNANAYVLEMPPDALIPITVIWGGKIGAQLLNKFPILKDNRHIIRRAAEFYTTKPHEFLAGVQRDFESISKEVEFKDMKPSLILRIAAHCTEEPREQLRKLKRQYDTVAGDPSHKSTITHRPYAARKVLATRGCG